MMRFSELESLGIAVAAISDCSDGDCSGHTSSRENRRCFLERCGVPPHGLLCPRQVHGTTVLPVSKDGQGKIAVGHAEVNTEADGLCTNLRGVPLGIAVADCVPVFLVVRGGKAGALVHAGREGTYQGISSAAVTTLCRAYEVTPEEMYAVIGPSAGPCCYEVSPQLAQQFLQAGLPANGRFLDLWGANRQQLVSAGVPARQITLSGQCTICGGAFHSYRVTGTPQRNLALLML